jgi:hypothetical protein
MPTVRVAIRLLFNHGSMRAGPFFSVGFNCDRAGLLNAPTCAADIV